jgi:hypothetical protein
MERLQSNASTLPDLEGAPEMARHFSLAVCDLKK